MAKARKTKKKPSDKTRMAKRKSGKTVGEPTKTGSAGAGKKPDEKIVAAEPKGVAVILEASHTCMTMRGIKKPGSLVITSAMKGIFRDNIASRNEVMGLIRSG